MENTINFGEMQFNLPKNQSNVIKVIGVGGGGSNAVNHMYKKGTDDVDFVICNTDAQALNNSPIPVKIQLGATLTEGLGAGANPQVGREAALESKDTIEAMLGEKTKMVFITVGMGGGTGTGAAPVIAEIAKNMGMLTVAIVTTPFSFEGKKRNEQAQNGLSELRDVVDSIIVINNNKLREVYGNLGFKSGFSKADEVLSTAAMGIAKVITNHFTQNIDFRDANTVLANSGTAIMGAAIADGANRAQEAITKALDSPLLNDNKIKGAKNVLLLIVSGTNEITIDEIGEINDFIQSEARTNVNIIMGVGEDATLSEGIEVTIVATGFNEEQQNQISTIESKKIVYDLNDSAAVKKDKTTTIPVKNTNPINNSIVNEKLTANKVDKVVKSEKIIHKLEEDNSLTLFDAALNDDEIISRKKLTVDENEAKETGFLGANMSELLRDLKNEKLNNTNKNPIAQAENSNFEEVLSSNNKVNTNHNELIGTSENIKNIDVLHEEIHVNKKDLNIEDDFIITTKAVDLEVLDAEEVLPVEEEKQMTFLFDLPINKTKITHDEATNNIHLKTDAVNANNIEVNVPEIVSKNKVYSLEDYMELEDTLNSAKAEKVNSIKKIDEVEPELKFQTKIISTDQVITDKESSVIQDLKENANVVKTDVSPMNSTINQLKMRTDERKVKMRKYNYTFASKMKQSIDDLEKQPAYKRNNVELNENIASNNLTRTSLETDGDDINFRSNNSFLHDNVD